MRTDRSVPGQDAPDEAAPDPTRVGLGLLAEETDRNLGTVAFQALLIETPDRAGSISAEAAASVRQALSATEPWRRHPGMAAEPDEAARDCARSIIAEGLFGQPLPDWVPESVRVRFVAHDLLDHPTAPVDPARFAQWHAFASGQGSV